MSDYYVVEPEVAGGWGEGTEFTRVPGRPTVVHRLHYCFDGWLGDDLLESTPCFIVTERLAAGITRAGLSGVNFEGVMISKSPQFEDLYPDRQLPNFLWMKLAGEPGKDDFALSTSLHLIISARALSVLEQFQISCASIEPFENFGG